MICIGENIRITVVEVRRGKVKIGIDGVPKDVVILREELKQRPTQEDQT